MGEGQIAEFVEDDEVEASEIARDASLPSRAGLGLEPTASRSTSIVQAVLDFRLQMRTLAQLSRIGKVRLRYASVQCIEK